MQMQGGTEWFCCINYLIYEKEMYTDYLLFLFLWIEWRGAVFLSTLSPGKQSAETAFQYPGESPGRSESPGFLSNRSVEGEHTERSPKRHKLKFVICCVYNMYYLK